MVSFCLGAMLWTRRPASVGCARFVCEAIMLSGDKTVIATFN